jgi:hypothetical protein
METILDHKGKYLMAQELYGRAGCSWRWTTFRKTCQGSNKWKQRVWHMMKSARPLTLRLIADPFNRNHKVVHKILTVHIGMRKVCQHLASTSWQHTITKHCLLWSFDIQEHCSDSTPPYSPMIPNYFLLFPRIINHLWVHHFARVNSIQTVVTNGLKDLTEEAMFPRVEGPPPAMCCFWRGPCWNCNDDYFYKISLINFMTDLIYWGSWSLYPYKNSINEF